jgi:tetratricopeptide (TPR) repeat protein
MSRVMTSGARLGRFLLCVRSSSMLGSSMPQLKPHQLLWAEGHPEEGLRLLREVMAAQPTVTHRKELLDMLVGLNEFAEGLQVADALVREGEGCANSMWQRAECLERLGRRADALKDLEHALQLDSDHIGALRRLAHLADPTRGAALLTRAMELVDDEVERADFFYERGITHTRAQLFDEALRDFNAALELNAMCAPAHAAKGDVFLIRKEYASALVAFQRFIDVHQNYYTRHNSTAGAGDSIVIDVLVKRCACYAGLEDWEMVGQCSQVY